MTRCSPAALSLLLAIGVAGTVTETHVAGQYATQPLANRAPLEWQTGRFEVRRIAIAPGAQTALAAGEDTVLVFLTADLDGRMPAAEAVWRPRGSGPLENHAQVRFEAIAIGLKDAATGGSGATPPEALPVADPADVRILIDNSRVTVVKIRSRSNGYTDARHFHREDMLSVYLGGGYVWPWDTTWGTIRVRRGDVDLVPANTLHTSGNAGSDPIDFLAVVLK